MALDSILLQMGVESVECAIVRQICTRRAHGARAPGRSGQRGFSLVELMVGMVASVVAIEAALSMTVYHSKLRRVDEEVQLALVACRNNLEELRSLPFASLLAKNGVGFDVAGKNGAASGGLRAVPGDPDGLPGQFTVTVDQTSGTETVYRVQATVTWTGVTRRQTFSLETLVGPRE